MFPSQDTESEDEEQTPHPVQRSQPNATDSTASHPRETTSEGRRPADLSGESRPSQPSEDHMLADETTTATTTSDVQYLCPAELADKMDDLTRVMQEKFLSGMDGEHVDYGRIDNDAALDDDWMPEITRDAEEKYFEED